MTLTTLIDGTRETRDLADGTYLVGRGESCRIRFASPDVSERHAVLTVRGGCAVIEDLHSANGTLVNGVAIDRAEPLDGSKVVQVGSGLLRVSEGEGEGTGNGEQGTGATKAPPPTLFPLPRSLFPAPRPTPCARSAAASRSRSSTSSSSAWT